MDYHKLNSKWVIWYHDPENKSWDLKSYKEIYSFDTIEHFWSFHNLVDNEIISNGMFFIMKKNIKPLWEDTKNINGGCWSYKIIKKDALETWINLSVELIRDSLSPHSNFINGISISPKKGFSILKIWNNDKKRKNISNLTLNVPLLQSDSYIYKSFS